MTGGPARPAAAASAARLVQTERPVRTDCYRSNEMMHSIALFAFPETRPPPEEFTLVVEGRMNQPGGDETAEFSFDNVPIPRH